MLGEADAAARVDARRAAWTSRLVSQPTTARRGVPRPEGTTSAWISTRIGRVPSTPANTAEPGVEASRSPRNSSDGLATSRRPSDGHLEHADLVGGAEAVLGGAQDAEGVAAVALEIEHGVDHVLDHLGAGDLAVLGDVADEQRARCPAPWRSGSATAWRRAPGSRCRARPRARRPTASGSNRRRRDRARLPSAERRQDVGEVGLAGQRQRRLRTGRGARRAGAPGPRPPRPRSRWRGGRRWRRRRPAAAAASICRCRARRRSAAPSPARCRRR